MQESIFSNALVYFIYRSTQILLFYPGQLITENYKNFPCYFEGIIYALGK